MKKKRKILWGLFGVGIIFLLVGIFEMLFVIRIYYFADYVPWHLYSIKLNVLTHKLQVKKVSYSQFEEHEKEVEKQSIILTKDEIEKIKSVYKKVGFNKFKWSPNTESERIFSQALSVYMIENQKILWKAAEKGFEDVSSHDLNGDGNITYRETANAYLDELLKEK